MANKLLYLIDGEAKEFLTRARNEKIGKKLESNHSEFVYAENGWKYVAINFFNNRGVVGSEEVYHNRLKVFENDFYLPNHNGEVELGALIIRTWLSRN